MCTSLPCQKKKTKVSQARLEFATLRLQVLRATIAPPPLHKTVKILSFDHDAPSPTVIPNGSTHPRTDRLDHFESPVDRHRGHGEEDCQDADQVYLARLNATAKARMYVQLCPYGHDLGRIAAAILQSIIGSQLSTKCPS